MPALLLSLPAVPSSSPPSQQRGEPPVAHCRPELLIGTPHWRLEFILVSPCTFSFLPSNHWNIFALCNWWPHLFDDDISSLWKWHICILTNALRRLPQPKEHSKARISGWRNSYSEICLSSSSIPQIPLICYKSPVGSRAKPCTHFGEVNRLAPYTDQIPALWHFKYVLFQKCEFKKSSQIGNC